MKKKESSSIKYTYTYITTMATGLCVLLVEFANSTIQHNKILNRIRVKIKIYLINNLFNCSYIVFIQIKFNK